MARVLPNVPALNERPIKNTICLFDVDGTLSPARRAATPEMLELLAKLRQQVAIGYISGSDFQKQEEQLGPNVKTRFDFCFSENGLTAYRLGLPLPSQSFINWLGEEKYQSLVKRILKYISCEMEPLPCMRGTFVEFRNGMINVSPVGRNASVDERAKYEAFDKKTKVREKLISVLRKEFANLELTYSIGGQISFDVFPTGWDKTFCLQHVENDVNMTDGVKYTTIHFFGDKTLEGGNDFEIAKDSRTTEHSVQNPDETMKILREMFSL